jgi:hypothetical protein
MNRKQRRAQGQPSQAEFDRIADQMEATGCERCGARLATGLPYLVARVKAGWVGRCMHPACSTDFLPGHGLFVGVGIFNIDPWSEDDRAWFRANPTRMWRLRWPLPGEVETLATDEALAGRAKAAPIVADQARGAMRRRAEGATIAIAVHQFKPGTRLRTPFEFVGTDPLDSYTDAGIPVLMPFLAEIARRAAEQSGSFQEMSDAQKQRRLEATAQIIKQEAED